MEKMELSLSPSLDDIPSLEKREQTETMFKSRIEKITNGFQELDRTNPYVDQIYYKKFEGNHPRKLEGDHFKSIYWRCTEAFYIGKGFVLQPDGDYIKIFQTEEGKEIFSDKLCYTHWGEKVISQWLIEFMEQSNRVYDFITKKKIFAKEGIQQTRQSLEQTQEVIYTERQRKRDKFSQIKERLREMTADFDKNLLEELKKTGLVISLNRYRGKYNASQIFNHPLDTDFKIGKKMDSIQVYNGDMELFRDGLYGNPYYSQKNMWHKITLEALPSMMVTDKGWLEGITERLIRQRKFDLIIR